MLKQIAVRLEEELIKTAKMKAVEEGVSIQSIFSQALESYFGNKLTIEKVNKVTKEKPKKEEVRLPEPESYPTDDLFHLVPKTAKVGNVEKREGGRFYQEGPLTWFIGQGYRPHFDKNDKPIPFRFTCPDGTVANADQEEINDMYKYYGKPIEFEE